MRKPDLRRSVLIAAGALVLLGVVVAQTARHEDEDGFTDTPILPGLPWHVHDPLRPHPKAVTPSGRPGGPPSDSVVLFDGHDLSKWTSARLGTATYTIGGAKAPWKIGDGYFEVVPGSGDLATKEEFGDVQVHVEWMERADVAGSSQNRGNSGIFLMGLYEVQVLDSYNSHTYADGQAGAMYGQWPPLVNATKPPGQWQTYDIVFDSPRFQDGHLVRGASMTVFLNGVVLHNRKEEMGPTIYREVPHYTPGPQTGPIILQEHGAPVRFRNIWARRLTGYDQPEK
jgi:hypothetical protein